MKSDPNPEKLEELLDLTRPKTYSQEEVDKAIKDSYQKGVDENKKELQILRNIAYDRFLDSSGEIIDAKSLENHLVEFNHKGREHQIPITEYVAYKSLERYEPKISIRNNHIVRLNFKYRRLDEIPKEIKYFKELIFLKADYSRIKKIEGLEKLSNLLEFSLQTNDVEKIEGLENSNSLLGLNLERNKIKKIEGLEKLNNLLELNLAYNDDAKEIEGLDNLKQLKKLDLKGNAIKKIEGLEKLRRLQILDLGINRIEKIEGLDNLLKLEELNLWGNRIYKIEGLDELLFLKQLDLSANLIRILEGVSQLDSLEVLKIMTPKLPLVVDNPVIWGHPETKSELQKLYDKGVKVIKND